MKFENMVLSVVHHTHWDREWYQSFEAMQIRLRDALRTVVKRIEQGEIDSFYLDGQTCVLDDYREIVSEEEFGHLEKLIRSGKVSVGPWYVLADEFLCPPEACIKNLEIGRRMAKKYGSFCDIGYLPDTFGHIGSMPQILKEFGIACAVIWRGADPKACEVLWEGNDKSRVAVLVLSTRDGYYQTFLKHETYEKELDAYLEFHQSKDGWNCPVLFNGADHTICSGDAMQKLRRYGECRGIRIQEVLMDQVCENLLKQNFQEVIKGELRDPAKIYVLSGTWSTRMYLKVLNQKCGDALIHRAEFLNAWENGASESDALLERLWKRYLVNQAHDSICGCSIDQVESDMKNRYRRLMDSVEEYEQAVLNRLFSYHYPDSSEPNRWLHVICNTPYCNKRLIEARILINRAHDQGSVSLYDGEKPVRLNVVQRTEKEEFFHDTQLEPWYDDVVEYLVEFELEFKGMEHICLEIRPCSIREEETKPADMIFNDYYELTAGKRGITVKSKANGRIYENQHVWTSLPDDGDSYTFSPPPKALPVLGRVVRSECRKDSMKQTMDITWLLELPPHPSEEGKEEKVTVVTRIQLLDGDPMIYVRSRVSNQAANHKLRIEFTLPAFLYHESDTAFDLVKRPVRAPFPAAAAKGEEAAVGQDPTSFQIYAGDLQIVHIGMQEYEVERSGEQCVCRLTALRCIGALSRRDLRTRGGGAGPGYQTPDAQGNGEWEFEYGLIYGPEFFTPEHAVRLKTEPLVKQSCCRADRELRLWIEGEPLYSSYQFSGGHEVLRLFNQQEEEETWTLHFGEKKRVWLSDLKGQKKEFLGDGLEIVITAPGKKIITVRMEKS
jgi:mannosylglycerate hydrolase